MADVAIIAAHAMVNERYRKRRGKWNTDTVIDEYVTDSLDHLL